MRFLDQLTGKTAPPSTEAGGVDAKPQPAGAPAQAAAVPVDHQAAAATEPAEPHIDDHKPNPKVAVAVAGAAVSAPPLPSQQEGACC